MRLFEFNFNKLRQGKIIDQSSSTVDEAIEKIKINCSDFLSMRAKSKRFLYRGMKQVPSDIFISQSKDVRSSTVDGASSAKWAKLCDFYLKNVGFTALRGNSTFCSSILSEADIWGDQYFAFPLNGFSFGYSLGMSGFAATMYKYPGKPDEPFIPDNYSKEEIEQLSLQFIKMNRITNQNLELGMKKDRDIWIRGRFIFVHYDKYKNEIYKAFGFNFSHQDFHFIENPTETQQIIAVKSDPSLISSIHNASEKVEKAAVDAMIKFRRMGAMYHIKYPTVQKYGLKFAPKSYFNMKYITPENKKYAQSLIKKQGINNEN